MLSPQQKEVFARLEMEYPAVAVKFCFEKPEGVEPIGQTLAFCEFVSVAQKTGRTFYTDVNDDNCWGKMVLGQVPKNKLGCFGMPGFDLEVFKTPAAQARFYRQMPTLSEGAYNYTVFSPVADCDFDPDLIICVADTQQCDILLRATSYISGDFWESTTTHVVSCAWTYAYPMISGKVNHCFTGMHHGMKRRGIYPPGLHILSIPFTKILEVTTALQEMPWTTIALRTDEESKAEYAARAKHWGEISTFAI